MSLNPGRSSALRKRIRFANWSLRTRLLVALVGLFAMVCVVISLVTGAALRHFLIGQLDDQLAAAGRRAAVGFRQPPPDLPRLPEGQVPDSLGPNQPPGTLGARIVNGQVTQAGINNESGSRAAVSADQRAVLVQLPVDGRPYTRQLGAAGNYRLAATRTADGDVMVTGLPLSGVEDTVNQLAVIEIIVAGIGLLAAALAAAVIVQAALRPLRRVAATAVRVSELPLDRGEVALSVRVPEVDTNPSTEVGQVGAALNRMLGHVAAALTARHASETRVRKFVADASHELRTPLAAIRGYAELTRRFNGDVPDDVAHAMSRVESESARMTTLVNDLLLLARLDSGRPLAHDSVDLSRLVVDVLSDARIAGPQRRWRLELPEQPVIVVGDESRLHQVLANLLANANTHTPPGTTITLGLDRTDVGQVSIEVVDDGPGIPAPLLPQVFDRFARGDSARTRTAGSTGLGLAIVAAVVAAHHGTVTVTSAPGRTAFTVQLPTGGDNDLHG